MSISTFGRVGAAVALAVGLVVATALPASASATGVVIEGSSTFDLPSGLIDFDQHVEDHPTTNICAPNSTSPSSIPVSFDSSGSGTVGASTTQWVDLPAGGNTHKTRVIIDSGTMALSGTGTVVTLVVRFQYRTCDSLTNFCTTNPVTLTLTGPSVGHHPAASARVTVAGLSSTITTPLACNSIIRAGIQGATANVSLNLHFT